MTSDKITCFAYGSNMSSDKLRDRAPSAIVIAKGQLFEHVLRWHKRSKDGSGKCDAYDTGRPMDFVWGVLFALDADDKRRLDQFEGLGIGYIEKPVSVSTVDGIVSAVTYVATNIDASLFPYHWYKNYVLAGAREHRFPSDYIEAIDAVRSRPDPDVDRKGFEHCPVECANGDKWRRMEAIVIHILRGTMIVVAVARALGGPGVVVAQDKAWPQRVLITNDNGIEDVSTQALARRFARRADVVLVASNEDRSGTSNLMTFTRTGRFVVKRRDIGEGVRAWALDGYPADCVVFAVAGPMADAPPDLVVSGINGGANTSDEWFGSGTIGAARTAAFLGIPAIAVSGIDDDDPDAVAAVVDWVLRLAQSGIMEVVHPPSYLTVSLPVGPPSEITGVEVVDRARGISGGAARLDVAASQAVPGKEVWTIAIKPRARPGAASDVAVVAGGRIAIVPMRVGDADPESLDRLRANSGLLPTWQPPSKDR